MDSNNNEYIKINGNVRLLVNEAWRRVITDLQTKVHKDLYKQMNDIHSAALFSALFEPRTLTEIVKELVKSQVFNDTIIR